MKFANFLLAAIIGIFVLRPYLVHARKHIDEATLKRSIGDAFNALINAENALPDENDEKVSLKKDVLSLVNDASNDVNREVDDSLTMEINKLEEILKNRKRNAEFKDQKREIETETKERESSKKSVEEIVDNRKDDAEQVSSREESAKVFVDNSVENLVELLKRGMGEKEAKEVNDEYWDDKNEKKEIADKKSTEKAETVTKKEVSELKGSKDNNAKKEMEVVSSDVIADDGSMKNKREDLTERSFCGNEKKECNKKELKVEATIVIDKKEIVKKDTGREHEKDITLIETEKKKEASANIEKHDTEKKEMKINENARNENKKIAKKQLKKKAEKNTKDETKKSSSSLQLEKKESAEVTKLKTDDVANTVVDQVAKKETKEDFTEFSSEINKENGVKKETKGKEDRREIMMALMDALMEQKREHQRVIRREKLQVALKDLLTVLNKKRNYVDENDLRDNNDEFSE